MSSFSRTDRSHVSHWWWTIDRWSLAAVTCLMAFGALLMLAASPAAGGRIGLDAFHLASRQLILLPFAAALLLGVSLMSPRGVRRIAVIGFLISLLLLAVTLLAGAEIKGSKRWLTLGGLSLQASEFVKPCFAVTVAWLFAAERGGAGIPGSRIAFALWGAVVGLLLLQPDLGQSLLVTAIWGGQLFLAGLPLLWVSLLGLLGLAGLCGIYFALPHVRARIDSFFDPAAGDRYQVNRAQDAFQNGGLFGQGPGEGTVKATLPDAHSDFIFAVAGEELGVVVCLAILMLFAFIVLRGLARVLKESDLFVVLAVSGLLIQFGLQALINMASALHLIPTKGMTLPFISYGGSSLMALALGIGMVLALTRRRAGQRGGP